jgi:prevent-host-death family protein
MEHSVNIHEAKTHFSKLIARVKSGEEIIIAIAGKPVAKLVPIHPTPRARKPGSGVGKVRMAPDFDAPLPDDLVDAFEHP